MPATDQPFVPVAAVATPFSSSSVMKAVPTVLVPLIFWFLPLSLDPKAHHALAITLFMILAWGTEVLDPGLTGLTGCYLFWALKVVSFEMAFSGFANDTPWFLMGAILFGTMASKSGLGKRLAYMVTLKVGTNY